MTMPLANNRCPKRNENSGVPQVQAQENLFNAL